MLLFSAEKTEFPFFEITYYRVLPTQGRTHWKRFLSQTQHEIIVNKKLFFEHLGAVTKRGKNFSQPSWYFDDKYPGARRKVTLRDIRSSSQMKKEKSKVSESTQHMYGNPSPLINAPVTDYPERDTFQRSSAALLVLKENQVQVPSRSVCSTMSPDKVHATHNRQFQHQT